MVSLGRMAAMARELVRGLIDDAAVFPPGNAPLDVAVDRHVAHKASPHADLIGPLLVPSGAAGELVSLLAERGAKEALEVALIARPGADVDAIPRALAIVDSADASSLVQVHLVEMGWVPDWRDVDLGGRRVALEVSREATEQAQQLDDIVRGGPTPSAAKFRTGATPTWSWPDELDLAGFISRAVERRVMFKLTGGLHHAVRGEHPDSQHGLLNVLAACHAARNGSGQEHLEELLSIRDADALSALASAWDVNAAGDARRFFLSYGCCEVTDPLTELADLGLLTKD